MVYPWPEATGCARTKGPNIHVHITTDDSSFSGPAGFKRPDRERDGMQIERIKDRQKQLDENSRIPNFLEPDVPFPAPPIKTLFKQYFLFNIYNIPDLK